MGSLTSLGCLHPWWLEAEAPGGLSPLRLHSAVRTSTGLTRKGRCQSHPRALKPEEKGWQCRSVSTCWYHGATGTGCQAVPWGRLHPELREPPRRGQTPPARPHMGTERGPTAARGRGDWAALSSAPGAVWRPSALPSARGREVGAAGAALAKLLPEQRGCWRPRSGAEGGKRCPQASAEPFLGAWGRSRGCWARWAAAGGSGCAPSSRRWTRGLRGWGTSGERRSLTNNRSLVCACQIAYKAQELSSGALLFIPVQSPDVYSLLSLETLLAQLCISVPTSYPLDDNLIAFHQWFKLLLIGNKWNHTWKCFTGKTWFKTDTCDNFDFVGSWHVREISEQAS